MCWSWGCEAIGVFNDLCGVRWSEVAIGGVEFLRAMCGRWETFRDLLDIYRSWETFGDFFDMCWSWGCEAIGVFNDLCGVRWSEVAIGGVREWEYFWESARGGRFFGSIKGGVRGGRIIRDIVRGGRL
jgi:hypothetical protein